MAQSDIAKWKARGRLGKFWVALKANYCPHVKLIKRCQKSEWNIYASLFTNVMNNFFVRENGGKAGGHLEWFDTFWLKFLPTLMNSSALLMAFSGLWKYRDPMLVTKLVHLLLIFCSFFNFVSLNFEIFRKYVTLAGECRWAKDRIWNVNNARVLLLNFNQIFFLKTTYMAQLVKSRVSQPGVLEPQGICKKFQGMQIIE